MTRSFIIFFCIISLVACNYFKKTEFTKASGITIPVTVEEAKSIHNPPQVDVTVKRVKRKAGGGSCHVLPVCLIVGAALLIDRIFPEEYDYVTIKEDGKTTFAGKYNKGGSVIEGYSYEGNVAKGYANLNLKELEKNVLVQVFQGKRQNGKIVDKKLIPILSQVNLIKDYQNKLKQYPDKIKKRGSLIAEALRWLGPESETFVGQILTDPQVQAETKGIIIQEACYQPKYFSEKIIKKILPNPPPNAAVQALFCYLKRKMPAEEIAPFIPATIKGICEDKLYEYRRNVFNITSRFSLSESGINKIKEKLWHLPQETREQLKENIKQALDQCDAVPNTTYIKYKFGFRTSPQELEQAISDSTTGHKLIPLLNFTRNPERELAFNILKSNNNALKRGIVKNLSMSVDRDLRESLEELKLLAEIYISATNRATQAHLLYIFSQYKDEKDKIAQAKEVLKDSLTHQRDQNKPVVAIALFLLGENENLSLAAKGLTDQTRRSSTTVWLRDRVHDRPTLIYLGFQLQGCQGGEIKKIREMIKLNGQLNPKLVKCLQSS